MSYKVTRTSEREGKTHKVEGPDGSIKYFGDPDLKNKPNNPGAKANFYSRHAESLKNNPHFRAYARETWADGGMVEPTPEDMRLRDLFISRKSKIATSSDEGGGGGGSGLGLFEILKGTNLLGLGLPKDIDKEIEGKGIKSDVSLNVADGGLIGSLAALNPMLKQQYDAFPQIGVYTDSAHQQVPTRRPTALAEGGDVELDVGGADSTAQDEGDPTADGIRKRKPIANDPEASARAETALRLREEINALQDLNDADKTILRDKIVGLGATQGIKADEVKATYQTELTKIRQTTQPAPLPQPIKKEAPAAPAAPQKVVLPMTLEGGTGDLAVQERKPIDRRRQELESELFKTLGGDIGDKSITAERRKNASTIAGRLMAVEDATSKLVDPSERVAQIMGTQPLQEATNALSAPAVPEGDAAPTQAASAPITGTPVVTPAAAPIAQPAPAPKAFADLTPAEQDSAIKDNANYKTVLATAQASGFTPDVAQSIAYSDTRRALENEIVGPVTPKSIDEAARSRPLMADYASAVRDEAKYRTQIAELDNLQTELTAGVNDAMQKTQIEQGLDLQKRLALNGAMVEELKTSAVNDLMTAKLKRGVPPFSALLGLIGAGLGSGGSVADFVRVRAKEELDTQLSIYDKKRTMIGDLVAQGDNMVDAYKKTEAALKLTYATSIERELPSIRDARAKAKALAEVAKIRAEALKDLNKVVIDRNKADFDIVRTNLTRANASIKPGIEYIKIMADLSKAEENRKNALKVAGIRASGDKDAAKIGKLEAADMPLSPGMYAASEGKVLNNAQYQRAVGRDKELAGSFVPVLSLEPTALSYEGKSVGNGAKGVLPKEDKTRYRYAGSAKNAETLRTNNTFAKNILPALYEINSIAASSNYRVQDKDKQGKLNVLRSQVTSALAKLFELGTLQDSDRKAMENVIPAFTLIDWGISVPGSDDAKAAIEQLTTLFTRSIQNQNDTLLVGSDGKDWDGSDSRPSEYRGMAATTRAERAAPTILRVRKKGSSDIKELSPEQWQALQKQPNAADFEVVQ